MISLHRVNNVICGFVCIEDSRGSSGTVYILTRSMILSVYILMISCASGGFLIFYSDFQKILIIFLMTINLDYRNFRLRSGRDV